MVPVLWYPARCERRIHPHKSRKALTVGHHRWLHSARVRCQVRCRLRDHRMPEGFRYDTPWPGRPVPVKHCVEHSGRAPAGMSRESKAMCWRTSVERVSHLRRTPRRGRPRRRRPAEVFVARRHWAALLNVLFCVALRSPSVCSLPWPPMPLRLTQRRCKQQHRPQMPPRRALASRPDLHLESP